MVGDIIWALLPFTDLSGAKLRPVLVVADVRDARELDWIVCEITSGRASHSRELALASSDLHSGQLRRGSKLRGCVRSLGYVLEWRHETQSIPQ